MPFQPAPGAYPNRTYVRPNVQAPPPWPGVFHAPPRAPAEEPGPSLCFTVGDTPAKAVVTPQRKPSSTICPTTCGPTPNSDAKLRRNLADVYASFDCVLMNHAIEVSERAAAARIQGPREDHAADAALAAAAAASADAARGGGGRGARGGLGGDDPRRGRGVRRRASNFASMASIDGARGLPTPCPASSRPPCCGDRLCTTSVCVKESLCEKRLTRPRQNPRSKTPRHEPACVDGCLRMSAFESH